MSRCSAIRAGREVQFARKTASSSTSRLSHDQLASSPCSVYIRFMNQVERRYAAVKQHTNRVDVDVDIYDSVRTYSTTTFTSIRLLRPLHSPCTRACYLTALTNHEERRFQPRGSPGLAIWQLLLHLRFLSIHGSYTASIVPSSTFPNAWRCRKYLASTSVREELPTGWFELFAARDAEATGMGLKLLYSGTKPHYIFL